MAAFTRDGTPTTCDYDRLEQLCRAVKTKPFSKASYWIDGPAGAAENACALLLGVSSHAEFKTMVDLLKMGITHASQYTKLLEAMRRLACPYPGPWGRYKRKRCIDLWVAIGAICRHAMAQLAVAPGSGTAMSLCYLYDPPSAGKEQLSALLNHCYATFRKSKHCGKHAEHHCTLGLSLCGWHRESESYVHNGVHMS